MTNYSIVLYSIINNIYYNNNKLSTSYIQVCVRYNNMLKYPNATLQLWWIRGGLFSFATEY